MEIPVVIRLFNVFALAVVLLPLVCCQDSAVELKYSTQQPINDDDLLPFESNIAANAYRSFVAFSEDMEMNGVQVKLLPNIVNVSKHPHAITCLHKSICEGKTFKELAKELFFTALNNTKSNLQQQLFELKRSIQFTLLYLVQSHEKMEKEFCHQSGYRNDIRSEPELNTLSPEDVTLHIPGQGQRGLVTGVSKILQGGEEMINGVARVLGF